jgi:hypothetical protein
MTLKYLTLFITIILLIFGNTLTNLFPMALCENLDSSLESSHHNEEKNSSYLSLMLFVGVVIAYIIYINYGGAGASPSIESLPPVVNTEISVPVTQEPSVVLKTETVVSVNIPSKPTFPSGYSLDMAQKIYQQTKEIAALKTQHASLYDKINELTNQVYITESQLVSAKDTITHLLADNQSLIQNNKDFGEKTQKIVDFMGYLYKKYELPAEERDAYFILNGLYS